MIAVLERGIRSPSSVTQAALEAALPLRPSELLRRYRDEAVAMIERSGASAPRVFGSVARGDDTSDSDLDLIVTFRSGADIVTLLNLEADLSELLTVPVDIVSSDSRGRMFDHALRESVPL